MYRQFKHDVVYTACSSEVNHKPNKNLLSFLS